MNKHINKCQNMSKNAKKYQTMLKNAKKMPKEFSRKIFQETFHRKPIRLRDHSIRLRDHLNLMQGWESGRPEADIKGGVGGGSPPRIREAGRPT